MNASECHKWWVWLVVGVAGSLFTFLLHTLRAEEVDPLWEGSPHDCRPCIQLIGDEVMCVCDVCVMCVGYTWLHPCVVLSHS